MSQDTFQDASRQPCVAMLVSGGLEHAGGIGRWAGYLEQAWTAQALRPRLEIVDTRGHGHMGIAVVTFLRALFHLAWRRRQGRLGVIHANLSVRGSTVRKYLVGWLAWRLDVPLVLHLHGSGYADFYDRLPGWAQQAVRQLFARARHVIVLGQSWADWVATTLDVPRDKITVLYNGVSRATVAAHRVDEPCHIVLLGRIGRRKGVPELIDALAAPGMRERSWRATLAGDGEVAAFTRYAANKGLADRIALPGWLNQQQAAALMASADILVLPSHAENLPISIIEALSRQIAVIATPVGATPELLTDGQSALFVPVGDAPSLAEALARLIDHPEQRRAIASAGHAVFNEQLDIDHLARRLAGLHLDLIARTDQHPRQV